LTTITSRGLLAAAALVAGATALPSVAQAGTVTAAHLDWTQANVYDTAAPANTQRTWLGYTTQLNGGTGAPIAPATGDTANLANGGADIRTSFPLTSGSYDPSSGTGTIQLDGGFDYQGVAPANYDISIEQPKLVLDGLTGRLFAHGKRSGTPATYDASAPLYTLDLSNATVTLKADGSRVIDGIVPSVATLNTAFPQNYAVGSGPNRTPNTFGSFSLTVRTNGGDAGPQGPAGANGKDGATGPAGKDGTSATLRTVKAVLAKAPYKGGATRRVTVYSTKNAKLASGTLKGRVLKVTLASTVTSLSGKVKVKATGAKTSKTVSIPS
jgi:Htaa